MVFKINFVQSYHFCTSSTLCKTVLNNPGGKNTSSQDWLKRQLNDPWVKRARVHNFRCRSAFKLLQMNEKFNLITPGDVVVDCGAAPGSWSQVATSLTNASKKDLKLPFGKVIGIDMRGISPINGATLLFPYDFTTVEAHEKLKETLQDEKVDVVLSDMAPNASGMKEMDHDNIIELSYHVLRFAALHSRAGATCLIKLWKGRNQRSFEGDMKKFYENIDFVKPDASRSDSAEIYILARHFKGIKDNSD